MWTDTYLARIRIQSARDTGYTGHGTYPCWLDTNIPAPKSMRFTLKFLRQQHEFCRTYTLLLLRLFFFTYSWQVSTSVLFIRREESLPIFKRRLLGDLLDFSTRELQVQVVVLFDMICLTGMDNLYIMLTIVSYIFLQFLLSVVNFPSPCVASYSCFCVLVWMLILGKWLWVIQMIEIADLAGLTMFQENADWHLDVVALLSNNICFCYYWCY